MTRHKSIASELVNLTSWPSWKTLKDTPATNKLLYFACFHLSHAFYRETPHKTSWWWMIPAHWGEHGSQFTFLFLPYPFIMSSALYIWNEYIWSDLICAESLWMEEKQAFIFQAQSSLTCPQATLFVSMALTPVPYQLIICWSGACLPSCTSPSNQASCVYKSHSTELCRVLLPCLSVFK